LIAFAAIALLLVDSMAQENPRDINAVLRSHDRELLAINGVVGVYVGTRDDGKMPCLKVMVVANTAELERAIPKTLEGFPVIIEVTGEIKPLGN
jgi:hypothetical protein